MPKRLLHPENLLSSLLIFLPAAALLHHLHADPLWVFAASGLAIVPLAGLMGGATEELALRAGPGIGGLLNASFGNAAELILAVIALRAGEIEIVQASLTGSIIGNLLLVLGLAVFCGGFRRERQTFNRTAAGIASSTLFLGVVGLLVPTFLSSSLEHGGMAGEALDLRLQRASVWISVVLLAVYGLKLVFALRTHRHLYNEAAAAEAEHLPKWGPKRATAILLVATGLTAWMAEILVSAVEPAAAALGLSRLFIGVIVIAIVGNAAEHSTAVLAAMKGRMNLALTIAVESSLQIALFVAPVLVFCGRFSPEHRPMTLHFTDFEAFAVAIAVGATALIALDGETTWFEGVLLMAVYAVLGVAFYFL